MSVTETHVPVFVDDLDDAVERLIAQVLCRAHGAAEALNAPSEARAILQLAHSFADEFAMTNPAFDRVRFIQAATQDPMS